MPIKAKAQTTSKAKIEVKKKSPPVSKAKVVLKVNDDDKKEANRIRQQRFLEKHRDEINEKRREMYAARKEEGRCPRCGKKLRSRKSTLCKDCLEKAKDYAQK